MVIIRTVMNVLPEKQKEVLLTLLGLLQQPKKEKGCMSYEIFSDIEDKNIFNLISAWETCQHLISISDLTDSAFCSAQKVFYPSH